MKEAAEFLLRGSHSRRHGRCPNRLLLVGYSYGSIIAASASSSIPQVIGVASIAPPIGVRHWLYMFNGNYHLEQARRRQDMPQLLVIGDEDNFTSERAFMDVVKAMRQETTTGAVLKGADHFFRGREKDLMDILGECYITFRGGCDSSPLPLPLSLSFSHSLLTYWHLHDNLFRPLDSKCISTMQWRSKVSP